MSNQITINAAMAALIETKLNEALDIMGAALANGTLKIYDSGSNLKATLTLPATVFATAASFSAALQTIASAYPSASGDITGGSAVFASSDGLKTLTGPVAVTGGVVNFASLTLDTGVAVNPTGGAASWPYV